MGLQSHLYEGVTSCGHSSELYWVRRSAVSRAQVVERCSPAYLVHDTTNRKHSMEATAERGG